MWKTQYPYFKNHNYPQCGKMKDIRIKNGKK